MPIEQEWKWRMARLNDLATAISTELVVPPGNPPATALLQRSHKWSQGPLPADSVLVARMPTSVELTQILGWTEEAHRHASYLSEHLYIDAEEAD